MYIKSQLNLGKKNKITSNGIALGGPEGMEYIPIHEWLMFNDFYGQGFYGTVHMFLATLFFP